MCNALVVCSGRLIPSKECAQNRRETPEVYRCRWWMIKPQGWGSRSSNGIPPNLMTCATLGRGGTENGVVVVKSAVKQGFKAQP